MHRETKHESFTGNQHTSGDNQVNRIPAKSSLCHCPNVYLRCCCCCWPDQSSHFLIEPEPAPLPLYPSALIPRLGMGDEYLLPSIAVAVVGGTLITGGRGHYAGMLGGVLLLTALQVLLDGTTLPHAVRDIIFGCPRLDPGLARSIPLTPPSRTAGEFEADMCNACSELTGWEGISHAKYQTRSSL